MEHLLNQCHPSAHISIDGKSVGRGGKWKVIEDGILREFSVLTKNISMWHITDNEAETVAPASMGQFCSSDAYIIRWDYELITRKTLQWSSEILHFMGHTRWSIPEEQQVRQSIHCLLLLARHINEYHREDSQCSPHHRSR